MCALLENSSPTKHPNHLKFPFFVICTEKTEGSLTKHPVGKYTYVHARVHSHMHMCDGNES